MDGRKLTPPPLLFLIEKCYGIQTWHILDNLKTFKNVLKREHRTSFFDKVFIKKCILREFVTLNIQMHHIFIPSYDVTITNS